MALRLGEILVGRRLITAAQLDRALAEQRERGGRLGEILVRRGDLRPLELRAALAEQGRSFMLAASLLLNGGVSAGTPAFAAAQENAGASRAQAVAIGAALTLFGRVEAVDLEGSRRSLRPGDPLFEGEVVETGPAGGARLLFADGSSLEIGEGAAVVLDRFVYEPAPDATRRLAASARAALRGLAKTPVNLTADGAATAGVRA